MQTRRFRGASHIGYMQRYLESRFEDTVETKWDVSEEMMGLEFLLAMQAIVRKKRFCHSAKLVMGYSFNYFVLCDDLRLRVVLPDSARLRALAETLHIPPIFILWGRRHGDNRLSLQQALIIY